MTTYREESKKNFQAESLTVEKLQVGCLQRIADAAEAMAQNYNDLLRQKTYYEDLAKRRGIFLERRDKTIAALRGHITRLKKQLAQKKCTTPDGPETEP